MTLGQYMRSTRQAAGLQVQECAQRAEMNATVWSNLEHDRSRRLDGRPAEPRLATIEQIAKGLGVPVNDVLNVVIADREARINAISPDAVRIARRFDAIARSLSVERRAALAHALETMLQAGAAA